MSRAKGFDGRAIARRNGIELVQFNSRLVPDQLELLKLRIYQAIRRHEDLADLLGPAGENIDLLEQWNREVLIEIESLQKESKP